MRVISRHVSLKHQLNLCIAFALETIYAKLLKVPVALFAQVKN